MDECENFVCTALGTGKLPHNDYLESPYLLTKLCASKPGFVKSSHDYQLKEHINSFVLWGCTLGCYITKCALVWEGSGYPRNGTPMSVSISVLVHLVMKCTIQFIARLNSYCANKAQGITHVEWFKPYIHSRLHLRDTYIHLNV